MSVFILSLFLGRLQGLLSEQAFLQVSAIIGLLQNQILVAIGILGWLVFSGQGNKWHKILLYIIVGAAAVKGFSSTMLEAMMVPLAVLFMSKWLHTRRFPVSLVVLMTLLFMFLSPVKKDIRHAIVQDRESAATVSTADRATDWINQALNYWGEAYTGHRDLSESTSDASRSH